MNQRARRTGGRHAVQIGTNRGGHAFVAAAPARTAEVISEWQLLDIKPARAVALAAAVHARFPSIHTVSLEADGRENLARFAEDALVVSTVDTIEATRAVIEQRGPRQQLAFQLCGRAGGTTVAAPRIGLSGVVRDAATHGEAALLLAGFETMSAAASSRALTAAGDPVTAGILEPLRRATTRQTARYFGEALLETIADPPLTFFVATSPHPLVVRPYAGGSFSTQKELALDAVEQLAANRFGTVAAVALVDLDERAIDVLFVVTGKEDRRRVEGVMPFRAPVQRFTAPAIFTD